MVNRRFTQVATSDDEDDAPLQSPPQSKQQPKRKRMKLLYEDDDEEEDNNENPKKTRIMRKNYKKMKRRKKRKRWRKLNPLEIPLGFQEKGKTEGNISIIHLFLINHINGLSPFLLLFLQEDLVLLIHEDSEQKPYVTIIKRRDGSMMMTWQWFYSPEEAPKKGGGSWTPIDTRELFYSFHQDEVSAVSIMHKCITHFIPPHKQLPKRKQYPRFIIQKLYDVEERKLFRLTDMEFHNGEQKEISVLIEKTLRHIGNDLLDIETGQAPADR
ncbi:unnamed protein product [Lupinus luteus]|uniref:BAH domain-containing protein n=1 Tax=Lupinus luteus TaxID=3873 RepID=A0AAV1XU13_LUPLU